MKNHNCPHKRKTKNRNFGAKSSYKVYCKRCGIFLYSVNKKRKKENKFRKEWK